MPHRASILASTCLSVSLAVAVLGCSNTVTNSSAKASDSPGAAARVELGNTVAESASAAPVGVTLGYVEFQNHRVTIQQGSDEPRYTLADKSGRAVAETLTRDQFADRFPELFQAFEVAQARTLDASAIDAREPVPTRRYVPDHAR